MKASITPFLLFFALFGTIYCSGNTFHTASSGFWNNPTCWQNGQIPPLLGGDSIIIHHAIMFQQQLNLLPNTVITINSNASLCGHSQVIIPAGSNLHNYGEFDSDTVTLPGGHLYNYASGAMIVSFFGLVTNGGGWFNYAGALQVGASFTCGGKTIGIAENSKSGIKIFPQPAQNSSPVYIEIPEADGKTEIGIYSLAGNEIARFFPENGRFIPTGLASGYYLMIIKTEKEIYCEKLLIAE